MHVVNRPSSWLLAAALAAGATFAACEKGPTATTPPTTPPETPETKAAAKELVRPPHPTMASIDWGEKVALRLGADITVPADATVDGLLNQARAAYHSLEPGAEAKMLRHALQAWKKAPDDVSRGTALALAALALVTDPVVDGYRERLTDAYGLALYAGTVDASNPDGQSARAIVGASGGAVRQAKNLVGHVAGTPELNDTFRPLLAAARYAVGERDDEAFTGFEAAVKVLPTSWRLRVMLAERLNELGFAKEAADAIAAGDAPRPAAAQLAQARAQLAMGDVAAARPTLEGLTTSLAGVDEARRSEAFSLLADACLQGNDLAVAKTTINALSTRPGWQRESGLWMAELALRENRVADAKAAFIPMLKGTPTSPTDIERRIGAGALVVCAETKDNACFSTAERMLAVVDVRPALVAAATARKDRADDVQRDGPTIWAEVYAVDTDAAALRAARRAVQVKAYALAEPTLTRLARAPDARTARALLAMTPGTPKEEAERATKALQGAGPPLTENDLVAVIDRLGAIKLPTTEGLLKKVEASLKASPSPLVEKMIARTRAELVDPGIRQKRLAEDRGDHPEHAPSPMMPTLPGMPGGLRGPGGPGGPGAHGGHGGHGGPSVAPAGMP